MNWQSPLQGLILLAGRLPLEIGFWLQFRAVAVGLAARVRGLGISRTRRDWIGRGLRHADPTGVSTKEIKFCGVAADLHRIRTSRLAG